MYIIKKYQFIFPLTLLLLLCLYSLEVIDIFYISWGLLLTQIIYAFNYSSFRPLVFLILFGLTYNLAIHLHIIYPDFPLTLGYLDFNYDIYHYKTLILVAVFWCVMFLFLPFKNVDNIIIADNFKVKNNFNLFFFFLIILLIIALFGRTGSSIFSSFGYGSSNYKVQNLFGLSIFEYYIMFFPLCYYYSGKIKSRLRLLNLLTVYYIFKSVSFGGRIEVLQLMFMLYIIIFDEKRIGSKKLGLIIFTFILLLIGFGIFRSDSNQSFYFLISFVSENLNDSIKSISYLLFAHQIDVIYSSSRLIGLVQEGYISNWDRLVLYFGNLAAIITPYKFLPSDTNMSIIEKEQFSSGGGGLIASYYYVKSSIVGVIFIASYIGFNLRIYLKSKSNNLHLLYVIMLLSTFPRWYAYNPIVIFKMCFYPVIILLIIKFLSNSYTSKIK